MERFNPWWQGEPDESFQQWQSRKVKWVPNIINTVKLEPFALHFLTGPRQIGKTTAIKILINRLQKEVPQKAIFYYQCDELIDYKELGDILDSYYSARDHWNIHNSYIFLDEITFVEDWWRAIKARIDQNRMKNDVIILTGSASVELLKEKERFPGRRGNGQDLRLLPLTFDKYIELFTNLELRKLEITELDKIPAAYAVNRVYSEKIDHLFQDYLISGGFPLAIIDYAEKGKIMESTKRSYIDWLKADMQKINKNERYMKEVIQSIIQSRLSPVSWLSITKNTSINAPHTTESYISALESIYAIIILYYLQPDNKIDYKKNKKIHFIDPFLYRLLAEYTRTEILTEHIVESVVATHLARKIPTYYWRNKTEVDTIGIINGEQVGFEVKWGPKSWKSPLHLKQVHLLTKEVIPQFLGTINFE
ncbi:MAG TPA: ATP-binding protein [Candidatus Deferrimicrobium sp.]|nr:ATP-binding protein [Candidatus Deferrimicrobium sp.]